LEVAESKKHSNLQQEAINYDQRPFTLATCFKQDMHL